MQKNPYLVLQTYESATESEVDFAYDRLKRQYSEERFLPGDIGADAARKLTELEQAYQDVKQKFNAQKAETDFGSKFGEIESLLKQNKNNEAQAKLDEITDRNAEWHYLQSIVFYKKLWYDESKYQLEMAVSMDPLNVKYKDALNRLNVFLSGQAGNKDQANQQTNQTDYKQADGQYNQQGQQNRQQQNFSQQQNYQHNYNDRQMGGCGGNGGSENCCFQLICADCCCECMGGDLIMCC